MFGGTAEMSRLKISWIVIANIALMGAILAFVALYSSYERKENYRNQVEHFVNATIAMDNRDKLANYGVTDDNFQLTFDDFATLRTDMSLQKIISANYGTGVWGMLSDKMQWSSSDPDTVSVDYKQGGFYSDIRNYAYTSYIPAGWQGRHGGERHHHRDPREHGDARNLRCDGKRPRK